MTLTASASHALVHAHAHADADADADAVRPVNRFIDKNTANSMYANYVY